MYYLIFIVVLVGNLYDNSCSFAVIYCFMRVLFVFFNYNIVLMKKMYTFVLVIVIIIFFIHI